MDSIKKFMADIQPLDIILVRGWSPFAQIIQKGSELIRGNGEFSHCALVVKRSMIDDDLKIETDPDELLILESTMSIGEETINLETGKFCFGAQVRKLYDVIGEYTRKGLHVAVCHLKKNKWSTLPKTDQEIISFIISNVYDTYIKDAKSLYELNVFSLLGTIFPSLRPVRDDVENFFSFVHTKHPWIFCSELICIIYRDIGLIESEKLDVEAYLPVDFMNPGEVNIFNSIMELPPIYYIPEGKK